MQRAIKITLITLLVLFVAFFLTRNFFLVRIIEHQGAKMESRYGFRLAFSSATMKGLAGIQLLNLTVTPFWGDTLMKADSVYVRPSLLNLLVGRLKLNEMDVANMYVHLQCKDSLCNYAPAGKKSDEDAGGDAETNYARLAELLFEKLFDLLPQKLALKNINVRIDKDSAHDDISVPLCESSEERLQAAVLDNRTGASWNIAGVVSQDDRTFDINIFPGEAGSKGLPLAKNLLGVYCNFDSLRLRLGETDISSRGMQCSGELHAVSLRVFHPKLSDDTIRVDNISNHLSALIGKDFLEMDSATYMRVNKLQFNLFARLDKKPAAAYSLVIKTGRQEADNFFSSLPAGMFTELQGIEADGQLGYTLRFHLDASEPDSLAFDSQMEKEKFRIRKYGSSGLLKMNTEFVHTIYEKGRAVKSIVVGPSNPDFVSFQQVSPYLSNAVLTSEDGSFFFHSGFNEDAFRKSIAANYKAGTFVRGGSTITMQLVKNVFLTRHKTIARKAEEAFIVWLIESNRLCTKERMFEVYLNIVELGPGIYGVKDASRFYFNKLPSELTLSESIFLASLLPRPKWFKYSFDAAGNLKPYFADYYRVVSNFMLKKGLITEEEYSHIEPRVNLTGPAKEMVIPSDTIPEDDTSEFPD